MAALKRFLVFGYSEYYPLGGFEDFKASFDTKDEAVSYVNDNRAEIFKGEGYSGFSGEVVDSEIGKAVGEFTGQMKFDGTTEEFEWLINNVDNGENIKDNSR